MAGNLLMQVMTDRGLVNGTGQTEMTEVTGSYIDRLLVKVFSEPTIRWAIFRVLG